MAQQSQFCSAMKFVGFLLSILGFALSAESAFAALAESPFRGQSFEYSKYLTQEREALKSIGFKPWTWQKSRCAECPIVILPVHGQIEDERVYEFIKVIEDEKFKLLELFKGDCQEYNLLAHMAVGILGRESAFFESTRYKWKERVPGMIEAARVVRAYLRYYNREAQRVWSGEDRPENDKGPKVDDSSRGPTQIKDIPEAIAKEYGVTPDNLWEPKHAAVATMGYLMMGLRELKTRIKKDNLSYINRSNYVDYLPYIYFGSRWRLFPNPNNPNGAPDATPRENIYILDMQMYMNWVEIYEGPPKRNISL